jgi:hypothetical protein
MIAIPSPELKLFGAEWKTVFSVPQGTELEKGRHGLYQELVTSAGKIDARYVCYAWGTDDIIYYCGSVARDYARGGFKSNLQGRVHNYLNNHQTKDTGRINTNLMVFQNIQKILADNEVFLYQLVFQSLTIGNDAVNFQDFSNDPDLVHAVEQFLIAHYKRNSQAVWNRTPSTKKTSVVRETRGGNQSIRTGLADEIRAYVYEQIILPAKKNGIGTIRIKAGEIHKSMRLTDRMPNICSALDSEKFSKFAHVTLISRLGPPMGSSVEWVFGITKNP